LPLDVEPEPQFPGSARSSTDSGIPPEDGGLAGALGRIANKYLRIDVLDHSQDISQYIGYLLDTIDKLDSRLAYKDARDLRINSDNESSKEPPVELEKVPCSQVLHRVSCSISWHIHNASTFVDEPRYRAEASEELRGLCGEIPVRDEEHYVQQHPEVVFIVIKEHECGRATLVNRDDNDQWKFKRRDRNRFSERKELIQITSSALNKALKRIAEFEPYSRNSDRFGWVVGEMEAPYLFLFHHYHKLHDLVEHTDSYKSILDPLIHFLEQNYAEEYRSANELFQRGFVTAYHSAKLYKPYEIFVVCENDSKTLNARVLEKLPERTSDKKSFRLNCWSWSYNGREARRSTLIEEIDEFQAEEFPINKLKAYPLKYAKSEDIERLRETGRRFWNMRHQGLQCYTGWDENHDQYYVCSH